MAVGQGELLGGLSYIAIGRETAYGTYNTCTAQLEPESFGLRVVQEGQVIEAITSNRVHSNRVKLGRVLEGEVSCFLNSDDNAIAYILENALGGTPTSATATGETTGGLAFTHSFLVGDMDNSYTSLCVNARKGDATNGQVYQYSGLRVNELGIMAEIDSPIKMSVSMVGKDATLTSNDVSSALSAPAGEILNFINGRLSVENSFASLTSSSYWHIQSMELAISNSLKADSESRRIGSDTLDVLPSGIMNIELTCSMRFDTTTAYDAMLAATQLSAELEFLGSTLAGSNQKRGLKLQFPKVYINDAGDPEIAGPDALLTSEVTFHVLRDISSASGFAIKALLTNLASSYA